MLISFTPNAWEDYQFWVTQDRKTLKKINTLIKDIQRNPYEGLGKPEQLLHDLAGFWSRRISKEHRLVYKVEEHTIIVIACRFHYD